MVAWLTQPPTLRLRGSDGLAVEPSLRGMLVQADAGSKNARDPERCVVSEPPRRTAQALAVSANDLS
jgi:hypothetical protein